MPPKGIAGFERFFVRGISLSPLPPAIIRARQFFIKRPRRKKNEYLKDLRQVKKSSGNSCNR
jgi:hypothetical protein